MIKIKGKVKNIIKGNKKLFLGIIMGISSSLVVASASILFASSNVKYDNTDNSLTSTNVQDAIDELNTKANTCENDYTCSDSSCPKCVRATRLHKETCSQTSTSYYCSGAGYTSSGSKGTTTISYGNAKDFGTDLETGDAFDCDVNGDGKYDSKTERFYYVSDTWVKPINGGTDAYNSSYATLIYYNNTFNGLSLTAGGQYDSSNINNEGPVSALLHLPSTSQWNNVSLTQTNRQIYDELGTEPYTPSSKSIGASYCHSCSNNVGLRVSFTLECSQDKIKPNETITCQLKSTSNTYNSKHIKLRIITFPVFSAINATIDNITNGNNWSRTTSGNGYSFSNSGSLGHSSPIVTFDLTATGSEGSTISILVGSTSGSIGFTFYQCTSSSCVNTVYSGSISSPGLPLNISIENYGEENVFDYSGHAARLITYQEINNGCYDGSTAITSAGGLENCNFLFENTTYATPGMSTVGSWLETPYSSSTTNVWRLSGYTGNAYSGTNASATPYGIRPAIEVAKSNMLY